jgi:hypothetical protein
MPHAKSKTLIAAEWLWSHRGKNLWWTPNVLTQANPDPTSPKLEVVEAVSIFRYLEEKGLVFSSNQNDRTVFCLHEAKEQEWSDFISELKTKQRRDSGVRSLLVIVETGALAYVFWMLADFFQNSDRPWYNSALIFVAIFLLGGSIAYTVLSGFPNKQIIFGVFILTMAGILSLKFVQSHSLHAKETMLGNLPIHSGKLKVSLCFECTTNDPIVSAFASNFRTLCNPVRFGPFGFKSASVYNYVPVQSNYVAMKCSAPPTEISAPLSALVEANWPTQSSSNSPLQDLVHCFQTPNLSIAFFFSTRTNEANIPYVPNFPLPVFNNKLGGVLQLNGGHQVSISEADLFTVSSDATDPIISFWSENDQVTISWQCTIPADAWNGKRQMASIRDLGGAELIICLKNFPISRRAAIKPKVVALAFDQVTIKPDNFFGWPRPFQPRPIPEKIKEKINSMFPDGPPRMPADMSNWVVIRNPKGLPPINMISPEQGAYAAILPETVKFQLVQ